MSFEFNLPDIGEGLVEGEIVKWFVKAGDVVQEHQPIAAILTDKAEVEIPSPKAGKILKLYGKPGEKIKVHSPLVSIDVAGGGEAAAPAEEAPAETNKAISAKEASAEGTQDKSSTTKAKSSKGKNPPELAPKAPAASAAAQTNGGFVFNLPDLGEGLVEGELVRWFVKEGDKIAEHQPLAVVLTDKAEVEVPSPKSGVVVKLHGKPGSKVLVHHP